MCPAFLKFFIKMDSIVICVPCMLEHVSYELRFLKNCRFGRYLMLTLFSMGYF